MSNNQILSIPLLEVSAERKSSMSVKQKPVYATPNPVEQDKVADLPAPHPPAISTVVPPNNMCRFVWLMLIAGIYPMYVGYILYIGFMASYQSYQFVYNIPQTLSPPVTVSMILGVVPLGGVFSSLFLPDVLKLVNKRDVVFVFFGMSVVFCLVTCVPNFIALMIGRFGLGLVCAWQNSMGAGLIRDMSPIQYRQLFAAIFFTTRTFGMAFCFFFATLFRYDFNYTQFCVFGCVPAMITLIQVICVKIFIPILPTQLVAQKSQDRLKIYYSDLYSYQHVNQAVQNCVNQFKDMDKQFHYVHNNKTPQEKEIALLLFKKIQNRAMFASLFTTAIRQFCGVNYVVFYGNFAWQNVGIQSYLVGCFVMSVIQFLCSFLGLLFTHKFSRRNLYLVGGAGCIAGGLIMAICDLEQNYVGVFAGQIIFIVCISCSVNPIVWPYPIEVIPPAQTKWSSFVNWTTAFLITIVPVRKVSYQFFFAITAYFIVCEIVCFFFLIESKDLTLRQVQTNLMKQAYDIIQRSRMQMPSSAKGFSPGKQGTVITSVQSLSVLPRVFN